MRSVFPCSVAVLFLVPSAQAQYLGRDAARCSSSDVVGLIKEHFEKDVVAALNSNPFMKINGIQASITRMRESQPYERSIKKRFCRAEISLKFLGVNDLMKLGLALNGFNPGTGTLDSSVDYTVQLLEDGTDFVEIED